MEAQRRRKKGTEILKNEEGGGELCTKENNEVRREAKDQRMGRRRDKRDSMWVLSLESELWREYS